MDYEEASIEYQRRFMRWWHSKKRDILYSWKKKKNTVFKWFAHSQVSLWYDRVRRRPPIYHEHRNLPKITLSALAETGREELTIPVLKQRSYTDNQPVISSALADTLCGDLGIDGVLEKFNTTLGTSYSLGSKDLCHLGKTTLSSILEPFVTRNDDFGTVYAHLRRCWYASDATGIKNALCSGEEEDRKMRAEVLIHDRIKTWSVLPRRVWDLYANRVVPYWVTTRNLYKTRLSHAWAISHAWVDESERDANLDLIRIEMLNVGAQYAWLDVLCLRQEGGKSEHLRLEEWKLDVPTIGWVYRSAPGVLCYFNGLGQPLHLTPDYFKSDRCWFRRAWTLQEITDVPFMGGETGDEVVENAVRKTFDEQLARLRQTRKRLSAIEYVSEMQNRVSSNSLDKVAGLAYLFTPDSIPIYDAEMSAMDAWEVLMDTRGSECRAEFFFYCPETGTTNCWRPSWQQVMRLKTLLWSSMLEPLPYSVGVRFSVSWVGKIYKTEDTDEDWYEGYCIHSADVRGLDEGLKEGKRRQGEMFFKNTAGVSCTFKIFADHVYPIPDGSYALLAS
ncbi:hypothetical protein IW261DRAFT_1626405 [Armillaria novae-zelandiae]|uniref:Heterokaryon incompatibility domain-containing protein n=1 Tax=Armillaria novae-zelandiae TaxID=153914 RepID=A0AA39P7S4_9AGAR|nr:hypothetical protein IW261DRAFT_1626405 [Armillaria novae-zelandiae]